MSPEDRTQIIEQLKPLLSRASNGRANLERVTEDSLIIEDIGLSSLDLLELRCELEEHWNTRIADEEAMHLRTIEDMVTVILMHTGSRGVQ